jgi:hypothetical protein
MRSMGEGHPPVVAMSRSCPVETQRQYNLTQSRRERRVSKLRAPLPLREFVMVRCGMPPAFHRRCWGHLRPAHCKLIRSLGRVSGLGEVGEGFRPVGRARREVCAINDRCIHFVSHKDAKTRRRRWPDPSWYKAISGMTNLSPEFII